MKNEYPETHVVAEVALQKDDLWIDLPPESWPHFVRLAGSDDEILLSLASYG